MLVYLNKNFFKPVLIFLSTIFSVLFLLFVISLIVEFRLLTLIGFLASLVIYGALLIFAYFKSKSQKHFLKECNDGLEIRYPEVNFNSDVIYIPYQAIIGFSYYSIKTLAGWKNFCETGVLPDCLYLHFLTPRGKRVTVLIGHWDQAFADAFVSRYGIKMKIV